MQIDNWIRLGLVTVDYTSPFADPGMYSWADTSPAVIQAREEHDTEDTKLIDIQKGSLRVTAFGRAFNRAVIRPPWADAGGPPPE
jgi:abortive infection alpha-like protein